MKSQEMACKQDWRQHSKARRLLTFAGYRSREQNKWPSRGMEHTKFRCRGGVAGGGIRLAFCV